MIFSKYNAVIRKMQKREWYERGAQAIVCARVRFEKHSTKFHIITFNIKHLKTKTYPFSASAPLTISRISLVIAAWRALL